MEYQPDAQTLPTALHTNALLDLTRTIAASALAPAAPPWNALATLGEFILALGAKLPESEFEQLQPHIWVARDANISASASIAGPCIIDHEAEIRHCAFIRGSALIGKRAVVGNSTELKNALLFDEVQVPHYNYVGDSILGYKAHMGAGSITSNVRADKSKITVHAEGGLNIETGLRKFGAILG
ncbi:MAG: UDP-N-acetylglucosamine pyrophosphorylase, partial [Oscillospiraceae bacterium]|nr:UDP-N-acetylglucosamine pyrophosphorylase [Oscillospiraceae bacterium]